MISRRIAVDWEFIVYLIFILLVLLLVCLFPNVLNAQYPSDQLYISPVVHATSGKLDYKTVLEVLNPGADPVTVSFIFFPANVSDAERTARTVMATRWLAPFGHEGFKLTVEIAELGITGKGMLIVNGCRAGVSCAPLVNHASNPHFPTYYENAGNFRAVSVTARIYHCCTDLGRGPGTLGDALPVTPWYLMPSSELASAGMDRISVVNLREDARYHTNITVENVSEFSETFVTVTLFDGTGKRIGQQNIQHLGPLEQVERSAVSMFPELAANANANRLNRTLPISSPWIRIEQSGSTPSAAAKASYECASGCPAFNAHASITDNLGGDFWVEPSQFDVADRSRTGEPELPHMVPGGDVHSPVLHASTKGIVGASSARVVGLPTCSVVGPKKNGYYEVLMRKGDQMVPWVDDLPSGQAHAMALRCGNGTVGR